MGASLTNDIAMGCPLSYFNFNPPTNLTNIPAYSQSFMQDGYSFTIIHFYTKKTTLIYLIKMHGLPIESFKKNENIQFRFIFHFCYDQENGKNNLFSFKTSAVFSFNYPFVFIPNLSIPFKIGIKYVEDGSDLSFFSTLKSAFKMSFHIIPKTYDLISSYISTSSSKLLQLLYYDNKNENDKYNLNQNDKQIPEIKEQEIQQIERKKIISQQELHILRENFSLNDTNQIPYVGIDNLGLTCYISAALHFISSVTPFVELLLNTKAKKNSTSYELQKIFVQLKMASIVAAREKKRKNPENLEKKNSKSKKKQNKNKINNDKNNKMNENKSNNNENDEINEKETNNNENKANCNENDEINEKETSNDKSNKVNNNEINDKETSDDKNESDKRNENKTNNNNKNVNETKNGENTKTSNDENKTNNNNENENKQTSSKTDNNNSNESKKSKQEEEKNKNKKEDTNNNNDDDEEEYEEEEDMYEEFILPINSSGAHFSSISILKFVSSFGKKLDELVFNEQDTHEFITILFDKIDSELGKEFAEKRKRIFGVTLINFIRCKNADYGSEIEEELNDISLPLVGSCSSISKSLDKITSKEQMKGDNMWDTGDSKLGKQEVIRFMKFKKLPPFLTFHLMRYAQNEYTMSCEELNSYFECPDIIDMKKYIVKKNKLNKLNLNNNNDQDNNNGLNVNISDDNKKLVDIDENLDDVVNSNETKYKLMAIIAHRGSLHSGHYVSYISPNVNGHWFLFNDSFVSESSIKEVQETYGKSAASTLFGISSIFHQSNDFYSYLVGYVRLDYIKQIKYGITAPIRLVPNALVMKYSVLILDLTNISDYDNDDDLISSSNSNSDENLNSFKKVQKPIYGEGEKIEWSDINETIENLIISSDIINTQSSNLSDKSNSLDEYDIKNKSKATIQKFKQQFFNNHYVFISYPETKQLFGPIRTNLRATDFIIKGQLSQFLITPKIEDPVFICKKKDVISVESRLYVFEKYNKDYLIKYEKKIITDPNYEFPIGSIITILPREPFKLQISQFEYEVQYTASYEDLQELVARSVIEKVRHHKKDDENSHNLDDDFEFNCLSLDNTDDVDSVASRVILYHGTNPLRPRSFRYARKLKTYGKLDYRILHNSATANSIDMFTSLSLIVVDLSYRARHFSGLWLSRHNTIGELFEWAQKIVKKDDQNINNFVVSTTRRNRILSIVDRHDDIDFLNEVRIDLLKTDFPSQIEDYDRVIKKFGSAPIEVRTVLYEPLSKQFNSIGFFYFTRTDTYEAIARRVAKSRRELKDVLTQSFSVETQSASFRGFKPKSEVNVVDSLAKICQNPNFRGQRPILTIQISKRPVV